MANFLESINALNDSFLLALAGFNPVALFLLSLVVGLFQPSNAHLALKALGVSALSMLLIWGFGLMSGSPVGVYSPIELEFQIQSLMSFVLALCFISLLGLMKKALGHSLPTHPVNGH
jgi:uncharacterized membrane protein